MTTIDEDPGNTLTRSASGSGSTIHPPCLDELRGEWESPDDAAGLQRPGDKGGLSTSYTAAVVCRPALDRAHDLSLQAGAIDVAPVLTDEFGGPLGAAAAGPRE